MVPAEASRSFEVFEMARPVSKPDPLVIKGNISVVEQRPIVGPVTVLVEDPTTKFGTFPAVPAANCTVAETVADEAIVFFAAAK